MKDLTEWQYKTEYEKDPSAIGFRMTIRCHFEYLVRGAREPAAFGARVVQRIAES